MDRYAWYTTGLDKSCVTNAQHSSGHPLDRDLNGCRQPHDGHARGTKAQRGLRHEGLHKLGGFDDPHGYSSRL